MNQRLKDRCKRVAVETLGREPAFWKVREGHEITDEMDSDWIRARIEFYDGAHWRLLAPPHRVVPGPPRGCRVEAMPGDPTPCPDQVGGGRFK